MDCDVIRLDLVGFHFGDIDDEPRGRIEAHLPSCPACTQTFLALKRSIETSDARPSDAARARLRDEVARELAATAAWSWWQPPLAVALAAAAMLLAASTASVLAGGPGGAPRGWPNPDGGPKVSAPR